MARKKKGANLLFVLAFIGYLIYSLFSDYGSNQSGTSSNDAEVVSDGFKDINTYAMSGGTSNWPNLANTSVTDQQNKLAKNYYVILDDSGSMGSDVCASGHGTRLAAAVEALSAFAQSLPQDANFGVMSFSGGALKELIPLGKIQRGNIHQAFSVMTASGGTPLRTAITRGYRRLQDQAVAQLGYGEYHLVVITDGAASDGQHPDSILKKILLESPVDVHTIGFCIGKNHILNQPDYLSYQSADNVEALRQGLQNVLAESPAFSVTDFQ